MPSSLNRSNAKREPSKAFTAAREKASNTLQAASIHAARSQAATTRERRTLSETYKGLPTAEDVSLWDNEARDRWFTEDGIRPTPEGLLNIGKIRSDDRLEEIYSTLEKAGREWHDASQEWHAERTFSAADQTSFNSAFADSRLLRRYGASRAARQSSIDGANITKACEVLDEQTKVYLKHAHSGGPHDGFWQLTHAQCTGRPVSALHQIAIQSKNSLVTQAESTHIEEDIGELTGHTGSLHPLDTEYALHGGQFDQGSVGISPLSTDGSRPSGDFPPSR